MGSTPLTIGVAWHFLADTLASTAADRDVEEHRSEHLGGAAMVRGAASAFNRTRTSALVRYSPVPFVV